MLSLFGPFPFTASSYILVKEALSWLEPICKATQPLPGFTTAAFSFHTAGISLKVLCNFMLVLMLQVSWTLFKSCILNPTVENHTRMHISSKVSDLIENMLSVYRKLLFHFLTPKSINRRLLLSADGVKGTMLDAVKTQLILGIVNRHSGWRTKVM